MSTDGGSLTTDQLVTFYQYVMRRCEQADRWQKAGLIDRAEKEISHLLFRLERCSFEVPDAQRREALERAFRSNSGDGATTRQEKRSPQEDP